VVGSVLAAGWPLWHSALTPGLGWWWLAGLGVLHTGLAYEILFAGMARLPSGRIALLQFVYPLTAIAVDALVHAHAQGRLAAADGLAETLRALLATPLIKAARLHKSFRAAMRADARTGTLVALADMKLNGNARALQRKLLA
jgi:hypothetical protein